MAKVKIGRIEIFESWRSNATRPKVVRAKIESGFYTVEKEPQTDNRFARVHSIRNENKEVIGHLVFDKRFSN